MDNRHRSAGLFHWPVPLAHFHRDLFRGNAPKVVFRQVVYPPNGLTLDALSGATSYQ
jgi:hypothetical protein